MKKEIKELHDIWFAKCEQKRCPIIDYLLEKERKK